jgi:hypothetical protein
MPTVDSMMPTTTMASAFAREPPERFESTIRPSRPTAKYSAGPKARARRATAGAASCSMITLAVPATKEASAATASAAPARPRRARR